MQNIYLFYGEDQKSIQDEVQAWKKKFLKKYPDSPNLSILKDYELSGLLNEINTPPFLGDNRLIIAYNLYTNHHKDDKYDKFTDALKEIPETTILVLIEEEKIAKNATIIKRLSKIGQVKNFEQSKSELKKSLIKELSKNEKTINPILADELVSNLNENPYKILNEAKKLSLYTEGNEITKTEIQQLVRFDAHTSVFRLMDDLSTKQTQKCINTLQELSESGEDLMMILHLVMRQIRLLLSIKYLKAQGLNAFDIAKKAKLQPFIVKKLVMQVENFPARKLQVLMTKLLEIDSKIKRGQLKYSKNNKTELLFELERFLLTAIH
jgi:DNA polymerase-3 subunit delta